jgi:hypothetical protein
MADYLADREHWSGSALSMVDREPERLKAWLARKDVDRPTEAMARGTWVHALMLGMSPEEAGVAFLPTAAEFCEPVWELTPGGSPKKVKGQTVPVLDDDGVQEMRPQDATPAGERRSMCLRSDYAKLAHAAFLAKHEGKAIVTPESQRMVAAMVRAVQGHERAAALLMPGPGLDVELTGRFVGVDGLSYQIRLDAARLAEDVWVEIKTVITKGEHRLDTLRPRSVLAWAQDGWARKSGLCHDGFRAITGRNGQGWWIIVEAREDDPRVSCVPDPTDSLMAQIGREGSLDGDVRGYLELAAVGEHMKRKADFRPRCTRPDRVLGWNFPDFLSRSMGNGKSGDHSHRLKGATRR